jgi:hypothetical protein
MMLENRNKVKNGSFRVTVPIGRNSGYESNDVRVMWSKDYEEVDYATYTVQMLTQNDYADGWQQIVPRVKTYSKTFKDEEGNEQTRIGTNIYRMKVNLAQLPEHLWHRMKYLNETHWTVRNGMHYYLVEATPVDKQIRRLVHLSSFPRMDELKEEVMELLNVLKENDVYGWVVIRAKNLYK